MNKEELELKKLKKEVDNLSLEKWKFYFGFIPIVIFLGSILYNLYELRTKEEQYDESRKDKVAMNYDNNYFRITDLNNKLELAKKACKDGRLDLDTQSFFCQQKQIHTKEINDRNESDKIAEENSKKIDEQTLNSLTSLETKIENLEEENKLLSIQNKQSDLSKNETEIKVLNQELDSILQNNAIVKATAKVVDSLTKEIDSVTENPKVVPLENKILVEKESWFKQNYYRQYGKTRISLIELQKSKKTALIELKTINTSESEPIGSLEIKEGETQKITKGGFIYEITFQGIRRAGKNPFTSAVYFKYRKYKA